MWGKMGLEAGYSMLDNPLRYVDRDGAQAGGKVWRAILGGLVSAGS